MMSRGRREVHKNSGFSLIELLIAISILAVISVTIVSFMGTSSRTYTKNSTEATLQSEAQLVANAVTDFMIDCTTNIDYNPTVTSSINNLGSGDFGDLTDGSILQIINEKEAYVLLLNRTDKKIYYMESTRSSTADAFPPYEYNDRQVLAENVTNFKVNKDRYADEHILWFELTYEKNDRTYTGNYQVNVRNHITLDNGATTTTPPGTTIQSITVSPSEYYINVVNGSTYTDGNLPLNSVLFRAVVKPGSMDQNVNWSLSESNTGMTLEGEEPVAASPSATFVLDSDASKLTQKNFRVIAEKDGVQGSAKVFVRKVTSVTVSHVSGLVKDEKTSNMSAVRKGSVVLSALVEGWNLGTSNRNVSWLIEYRSGTGEYKTVDSADIATLAATGGGCSILLGNEANTNMSFRVTATSTFDTSKHNSIEFGVKSAQDSNGNKTFARGVIVDLTSYFKAHPVQEDIAFDDFVSATVDPGYTWSGIVNLTKDGKLYIDYEAVGLQFYGPQLVDFYGGNINLQIMIKFNGYVGKEYKEGIERTVNIKLPEVKVYKTTTTLSEYMHDWNDMTGAEQQELENKNSEKSYSKIIEAMKALNQTSSNIVIAKGNTKAANFYIHSYNIVKPSLIGIYLNAGVSNNKMGVNIGEGGQEQANSYITASVTSSMGTKAKLQDSGVVTFKAISKNASKFYPVDKIPVNICVKDYYLAGKDGSPSQGPDERSYTTYNIYVANVEGTSIFIPGPKSKEWVKKNYASQQEVVVGPASTRVKITQLASKQYQMIYNNKTYIYNDTYCYWVEQ